MADRKRPPPIPTKAVPHITKAIRDMETKQLALAMVPFTPSDLLNLFVAPEHHEVMTEAYRLCEPTGYTQDLYVRCEVPPEYGNKAAAIRFWWNRAVVTDGFYVPHLSGGAQKNPTSPRPEAKPELVERWETLSQDCVTTAYRFAQVKRAFGLLNKPSVCRTLAHVRYHWPCIVMLLRKAGYSDLADSVVEVNPRADNANLSRELRSLLAPSNQTVASFFLIEDVPSPEPVTVPYELHHNF